MATTVNKPAPRTVEGAGPWAVVNTGKGSPADDGIAAVSRKCRHLRADLAGGTVDEDGCLVCPWHHSKYDVTTGRMVVGPQGAFAKVPGLGALFKGLTAVLPLRRGEVTVDGDTVTID
ncbi:MAG TPA: Rieske (2Fe-2S) protein [Mycobacteriales bacterium]|nr:Rieske (2Fe-2S) protein [Mycobacteriales bacterium]